MDQITQDWIENKIKELLEGYLLQGVIVRPVYNAECVNNYDNEASVDVSAWQKKEFILNIFSSFENLQRVDRELVLRHELFHIKDVMDPSFGYKGGLCASGEFEGNLANLIWEILIDMRLKRNGFKILEYPNERIYEFKKFLSQKWNEYQNEFNIDLLEIEKLLIVNTGGSIYSNIIAYVEREKERLLDFMTKLSIN